MDGYLKVVGWTTDSKCKVKRRGVYGNNIKSH
jgi:hypothetical protein